MITLKSIFITIIIAVVFIYAIARSNILLTGPRITITNLTPNENLTTESFSIIGKVENTTLFTIDDQKVYPNSDGSFKYSIVLPVGNNVIEFYATNKRAQEFTLLFPLTIKIDHDNKKDNNKKSKN